MHVEPERQSETSAYLYPAFLFPRRQLGSHMPPRPDPNLFSILVQCGAEHQELHRTYHFFRFFLDAFFLRPSLSGSIPRGAL